MRSYFMHAYFNQTATMALLATSALVALAACGSDTHMDQATDEGDIDRGGVIDKTWEQTSGTIRGKVKFVGIPPTPKVMPMATADCATTHTAPILDPEVTVDANGGLMNCFVYLEATGNYPVPSEAAVLEQRDCMYHPHVLGIQVGQELTIENRDPFLHYAHLIGKHTVESGLAPPRVEQRSEIFDRPEVMIKVRCEVHSWMKAYVGVMEHPFFATTAADGSFQFKAPAGDYNLVVWHERYGKKTMSVTVIAERDTVVRQSFQG